VIEIRVFDAWSVFCLHYFGPWPFLTLQQLPRARQIAELQEVLIEARLSQEMGAMP